MEKYSIRQLFAFLMLSLLAFSNARLSLAQFVPPKEFPQAVDLGVNGIFFLHELETSRIVGKNLSLVKENSLECSIADANNEVLKMLFEPNTVSVVTLEISVADKRNSLPCNLPQFSSLVSFKGIRLGNSLPEVELLLGDDHLVFQENGRLVVLYKIQGSDYETFLKHYNRDRYQGRYEFENGKLIKAAFGFGKNPMTLKRDFR